MWVIKLPLRYTITLRSYKMADACIPITLERIRARIEIGENYFVTTGTDPEAAGDIMSFSISSGRNQSVSTFRCQLSVKISSNVLDDIDYVNNNLGQPIVVYAGVGEQSDRNLPRLFTGFVTSITQDPHWDDARKFLLSVSGEDVFALMKFNKYSRRFKSQDDAFAVITGGKRREGGRMTQLRRVPAGKAGVDFIASGSNTSMDHSPLIKTPDPQGMSPTASSPSSNKATEDANSGLKLSPDNVYAAKGSVLFVEAYKDGAALDTEGLKNTEGVGCLCCMNPSPTSFKTGAKTGIEGLKVGEDTYPIKLVGYTSSMDSTKKGFEFVVTGDYPAKVTFIHPITGETATIHFQQVPPHTHRTMADGGPAVGTYDVYQV